MTDFQVTPSKDYLQALDVIKRRIQSAQLRAVWAVNAELLALYWDIGRQLLAWQTERGWGAAVVERMAADLQVAYPGIKGFSRTSLFAMRQFYAFFSPSFEFVPQPVGQIPWGHVRTVLGKVKTVDEAMVYAQACLANGWSRTVLEWQIEQGFHLRTAKAVSNFAHTLPAPQSEIGLILCKDKDRLDVEYALRDVNKPMGISSYMTKDIPLDVQSQLPTVQELEQQLAHLDMAEKDGET